MYLNIILLLNVGLAAGKMEPFIVGGDYVDIRLFPHSTYLYVECISTFVCGGSFLTNHIVLTAGHCLYECKKKHDHTIQINFGHSSIEHMKSLLVSNFLVHSQYNEDQLVNDIALSYTRKSVPFGDEVQRVAIVSRYPTRATSGYVTGWGVINSQGDTSIAMKYITQELQNHKTCEDRLDLPPGTFCAGTSKKEQHPDQGDSGGAFVVYKFIQIGLVSFKHADYDLVAYTNVTYFYSWIKKSAKQLSCDTIL